MLALRNSLRLLLAHPLTHRRPWFVVKRVARWQIASRLLGGGFLVDFVGGTRLLVEHGMTGATGNVYYGLHEFSTMAFVVHFLRDGDLFADIGANIGSYSILASGIARARSFAYEPAPAAIRHLEDNIYLNRLGALVTIRATALGPAPGVVRFTTNLDAVNHVALDSDPVSFSFECPVVRLDDDVEETPSLIKLAVHGFDADVLSGAPLILASPQLQAVIVDLNGQGQKYGRGDEDVRDILRDNAFSRAIYDPLTRRLEALTGPRPAKKLTGKEIWVKDWQLAADRLREAPAISVLGRAV
ncbi:MAG: FkbM family methyltransferase [Pseudomonadota bacterium]|nr:FkbM family methyltransferase [Pseudomonadota bacterium]